MMVVLIIYCFLFITGGTMKQGFKPKLSNDIEVGMKVLFSLFGKRRGTVKYVGPVAGHVSRDWLGLELDPDQGNMMIKMK